MKKKSTRVVVLAPLFAGAVALLAACGDSTTATTSSVVNLESTSYHTLPPTQSTLPPTTLPTAPGAGTVTTEVTEYTVQAGDTQFGVATKYKISLDALNLANADTAGYSAFYVGLVIKIPAGATIPTATTDTTTTVAGATTPSTPAQTTTTLAGGGSNCAAGSYTIQTGDYPGLVAKKFNVTVAQLDAANANTKGYKSFYPGLVIVIPAKTNC